MESARHEYHTYSCTSAEIEPTATRPDDCSPPTLPARFPVLAGDNEYGTSHREVPSFGASQFKVSNGELLEFVAAGGYREPLAGEPSVPARKKIQKIEYGTIPNFWRP